MAVHRHPRQGISHLCSSEAQNRTNRPARLVVMWCFQAVVTHMPIKFARRVDVGSACVDTDVLLLQISTSFKTADRSFRCASTCMMSLESTPFISSSTSFWYQFLHFRLNYSFTQHFFLFWFTTLLIHNYLPFHISYPRSFISSSRTAFTDFCPDRFFWATRFLFLVFPYFLFLCRALD